MKKRIMIKNTLGQDCEVYQGSYAVLDMGNDICSFCRTHRIYENGTIVFKLDDKPNYYKSFKKGEPVPFAYL